MSVLRDDFTCSCRRQTTEPCWAHRHRYVPPGAELGHIACEPHGHYARRDNGQKHPHDGYAYDGCQCVCCVNVRALARPTEATA